jgi:hypothetical protein
MFHERREVFGAGDILSVLLSCFISPELAKKTRFIGIKEIITDLSLDL